MSWASISRQTRHGRPVYVKHTTYDARLEADGLHALAAAGAPVPSVVSVDEVELVITEVGGEPDWSGLGQTLAAIHRTTEDRFGWHQDNVIGSLPQANPWTESWPQFFINHRLLPWLAALPTHVRHRIEDAINGPLPVLLDHDVPTSLLHGDLWSGNVVDGCYFIDPAVHYGDRELDLAFSTVFGGIPASFYEAYQAEWPLDNGWELRRPALQLYHLLVHVELFGRSYVPMVEQRLDQLGW